MRKELINKLFEEFYKDSKVIRQNLLQVMDTVVLSGQNDYEKISLTIKIEKNK